MSDIDWKLPSTGPVIQASRSTIINWFSILCYLAGIYFLIAASRRHVKETLSSGGKARIQFFWQHIASTLLLAMPYLRYEGLPNTFGDIFSIGLLVQFLLLPILATLAGVMLFSLFAAFIARRCCIHKNDIQEKK